jgi:hypothetical protein
MTAFDQSAEGKRALARRADELRADQELREKVRRIREAVLDGSFVGQVTTKADLEEIAK